MKSKQALHIAEHLWDDSVENGSCFDSMMKLGSTIEDLRLAGKASQINEQVTNLRNEIIARWANVIVETSEHKFE